MDGIKVLGTHLASTKFVSSIMEERVREERRLWEAIPKVPDLQCAWQILLQSAGPRANHSLRTMPKNASKKYAREHDEGIWSTAKALLNEVPGSEQELTDAAQVASLPMRMGRLGLRSAQRCAHAAYWASWADALPMIKQRTPAVANAVVEGLQQEAGAIGCIGELRESAARLDREGFWWRPGWCALSDGQRPPEPSGERGEWPHGWQYWASSVSDSHFREVSLLSGQTAARRAHLRSHSGWNAGAALAHAPTAREYTVAPHLFRVLLLERLQLPLQVTEALCEGCHAPLDVHGRHRTACPRTGRLKKRATPTERTLARIFREAGARVRYNAFLRDRNVGVPAADGRRIEVLAQDLPLFGGVQVAADITLRSVLTSNGEPHPHAADVDGAVLVAARRDKEATYPEIAASGRCKLVVVGIETGGRWNEEGVVLMRLLAKARAREAPKHLRRSTSLAWERRWTRMLSTVCAVAFAVSLVDPVKNCESARHTGGEPPLLADLLAEDPRAVARHNRHTD